MQQPQYFKKRAYWRYLYS